MAAAHAALATAASLYQERRASTAAAERVFAAVRKAAADEALSEPFDNVVKDEPAKPGAGVSDERQSSGLKEMAPAINEIIEAANGEPVRTSVLVRELQARGFVIGGQRPDANLSARLGQSGDYVSNGRRGWTRVVEEPGGSASEAVVPEGDDDPFDDDPPPDFGLERESPNSHGFTRLSSREDAGMFA